MIESSEKNERGFEISKFLNKLLSRQGLNERMFLVL